MSRLGALPTEADVSSLMDGLLDRGAEVAAEPTPVLPGRDVVVVGAYVDGEQDVRAVVMLDLGLGASLGGGLALMSPLKVGEAIEAGALTDELGENAKEVHNVAASWFTANEVHLKLADVAVAPAPVVPSVVSFLRSPRRRVDFSIKVPTYGAGRLAIVAD